MRSIVHILLLAVLFLDTTNAQGQTTLHADPRLSLLVKKPHSAEQVTASVITPKHKASVAKAISISSSTVTLAPATVTTVKNTKITGAATVSEPVKTTIATSSTTLPAAPAVKPYAGENGHAAGWTPPVHRKPRTVYSGKGFRVQIYNGPDRNKAITVKTEFMRMYPGIRTYLTYVSPSFRVKVGDYRNRSDAVGMLKEANSAYNPSMIVPDIITISTF